MIARVILLTFAVLTACAPDRPLPVEKGITIAARANRVDGGCTVRVGEKVYRVYDDLGPLRDDMRARFGSRMHQQSTEVRMQIEGIAVRNCDSAAITALHRAGFVKFRIAAAALPTAVVPAVTNQ